MYGLGDKEGGANQFTYDFTPENVNNLTENYIQYIQLMQGELAGRKFIQPPFFLPFNLNLEMEGLFEIISFQRVLPFLNLELLMMFFLHHMVKIVLILL